MNDTFEYNQKTYGLSSYTSITYLNCIDFNFFDIKKCLKKTINESE